MNTKATLFREYSQLLEDIFCPLKKSRNLYPSEIGKFCRKPKIFFVKEQSIIIIVDARVLSPSGYRSRPAQGTQINIRYDHVK